MATVGLVFWNDNAEGGGEKRCGFWCEFVHGQEKNLGKSLEMDEQFHCQRGDKTMEWDGGGAVSPVFPFLPRHLSISKPRGNASVRKIKRLSPPSICPWD